MTVAAQPNPYFYTLDVTTTATTLGALADDNDPVVGRGWALKAPSGNGAAIYVANSSDNLADATKRLTLAAGESVSLEVKQLSTIHVKSASGTQSIVIVGA